MGICALPGGLKRRIDIRIYHRTEIAFALLYFTGSKEFNRQMRLYANRKFSWSLSDHALTPYVSDGKKKTRVPGSSSTGHAHAHAHTAGTHPHYAYPLTLRSSGCVGQTSLA
jgi:hypothetical protein